MIRAGVNGHDVTEPGLAEAFAELGIADDRLRRLAHCAQGALDLRAMTHALRDPDAAGSQALRAAADGLVGDVAEALGDFERRRDEAAADFERALQRVGGAAAA